MPSNVNIASVSGGVQTFSNVVQNVVMSKSKPALVLAYLTAVQYMIECLALGAEALIIGHFSPLF